MPYFAHGETFRDDARARRAGRDNGVREAQSVCLLNALVDSGNRADFACQPDFTKGNEPLGECFAGFG